MSTARHGLALRKQIGDKIRPHPWLYRLLVGAWNGAFALAAVARALVSGRLFARRDATRLAGFIGRQTIEAYPVDIAAGTADDLRAWCEAHDIAYREGGWTFYLPPSPTLTAHMPFLTERYPAGAGVKILKDFRPPREAHYTRHEINPAPGAALLRGLTPAPTALLRVASHLNDQRLGPAVYDLVELRAAEASLTAYVVQHLAGGPPAAHHHAAFMARLKEVLDRGDIATSFPNIASADDFRVPDGSGNMVLDAEADEARFVDFQAFYLTDEARSLARLSAEVQGTTHFGGMRLHRSGAYPYQDIPGVALGKRDIERRWREFAALLGEAGVGLNGRLVFDVGCNTGLMLYGALADGAAWAFGWDRPPVAEAARRVLHALGATRFDIMGGELGTGSDFAGALPARFGGRTDGVLLYLAMSEHIGFPNGLAELGWRYMIYEGHANQGLAGAREQIAKVPWLAASRSLGERSFADGDSPARPIVLLARDGD